MNDSILRPPAGNRAVIILEQDVDVGVIGAELWITADMHCEIKRLTLGKSVITEDDIPPSLVDHFVQSAFDEYHGGFDE